MKGSGHRWVWITFSVIIGLLAAFIIVLLVLEPTVSMWIALGCTLLLFAVTLSTAMGWIPTIGGTIRDNED